MVKIRNKPQPAEVCPWCGTSGRTEWGACQGCGRYYVSKGWLTTTKRRLPIKWIALVLGVVAVLIGLFTWMNYPFFPDPITLMFKRPTTLVSSNSPPDQWAMWGMDIQQTRHVADPPRQPEGHLVWSVHLGTPTRSVPVIVDDVLYIGGHFKLLALDAQTGRTIWEILTTGPVHTSPAVAADKLYLGLQDWRVLAIDRRTGATRWEFQMGGPVSGSPAVANGIVYIGSLDGFLYALDAGTGKLVWKFRTHEQPHSPPAIYDGTLFVSSTDGSLYSLKARTGQTWLRFRTTDRLQDSPVAANGLVYFVSGGRIYAMETGAREIPGQYHLKRVWAQFWIWRFPVPRPPGQPGSKWRFSPQKPPHGIISSPAVAQDAFYVGDTKGYLYARDALEGTELWWFQAGGAIMASPVILGPRVYFGAHDGFLYALDRSNGGLLWKLSLGTPIQSAAVFAGGRLYIRTTDGQLHSIE